MALTKFPARPRLAPLKTGVGIAFLAALVAALASCKKPPPPPPPAVDAAKALAAIVASCASVSGDVKVRRPGQAAWEPVAAGSVFRVGDEVKTGPLSTVRIEFLTGGGLEMEESSSVVIDVAPPPKPAPGAAAAPAGESRVSVKEGVVRGFLPAAAQGAELHGIVIRNGEGDEMRLASKPGEKAATFRLSKAEKGTEIAVLQGAAAVKGAKGEAELKAGQLAVAGGGELGNVAELIDFPQSVEPGIDARFQFAPGLAIRLAWREVQGATGYRVQVAHDLSFQTVEMVHNVEGTDATFTPPVAGMHAWRVASRDAAGRYGEYGFARRFHCEEQSPRDLLVGPADGSVVKLSESAAEVAFSWESAGGARAYRLVLASGPDLIQQKVNSAVVQGQRAALEIAAAGDYWWGVYAENGSDQQPIFVRPRRLSVRKAPKPKVEVPKSISRWGN